MTARVMHIALIVLGVFASTTVLGQVPSLGLGGSIPLGLGRPVANASLPPPTYAGISDTNFICLHNLYISPTGSDSNDGLTSVTAVATVKRAQAIAVAAQGNGAGYCLRYLPGTYLGQQTITTGGNADTLTGYMALVSDTPGAALLRPAGTNFNAIDATTAPGGCTTPPTGPGSYLIITGFDIVGGAPSAVETGGSAISAQSGHHLKIFNNALHNSGGGGIRTSCVDYVLEQQNNIYNNAWFNASAYSGVSNLEPSAFDAQPGYHFYVRQNKIISNGEGFTITATHTDGNGIILDSWSNHSYVGQVLIDDNVIMHNGGRCIEALRAHGGGMIRNNTCFHNVVDPYLATISPCEISMYGSTGFTIVNNIADTDPNLHLNPPSGTAGSFPVCDIADSTTANTQLNLYYNNSLFSGGNAQALTLMSFTRSVVTTTNGNLLGTNDLIAAPSTNQAVADFHLATGSPMAGAGTTAYGTDAFDFYSNPRVVGGQIDIGATQGAVTPSWMLAGATDDLQFTNQLYTSGNVLTNTITNGISGFGGTDLLYTSPPGYAYVKYSGSPRVAYATPGPGAGLLVEPVTVNWLTNVRTPGTQTTSTLAAGVYTLWVNAASLGSATLSGCATGVATHGVPFTFMLASPAACTVTPTTSYPNKVFFFQLENSPAPTSGIPSTSPTGLGTAGQRGNDKIQLIGTALTAMQAANASAMIHLAASPVPPSPVIDYLRGPTTQYLVGFGTVQLFSTVGADQLQTNLGSGVVSGPLIAALGWDATGRSVVGNGGTVASDSTTVPTNASVWIADISGGGVEFGGAVKEFTDWNFRLSDTTLKGLTNNP